MKVISKFNRPTPYDHAEYGQIWVAELEGGVEQYIQLSRDEKIAQWWQLGDFLEDMIQYDTKEMILDYALMCHERDVLHPEKYK